MAFSEHHEMCISSNFKARIGVIFTLPVSIQDTLGYFPMQKFSSPSPAFLCVLHCCSTCSLQLLQHVLCKLRTLHPWEQGTNPPTGTADSPQELQGKERAVFCPWPKSTCSFPPQTKLAPRSYISLGQTPWSDCQMSRPSHICFRFSLLATAEAFTGGWTVDVTIVPHSYSSLAGCWCGPTAGTSITCRVERVTTSVTPTKHTSFSSHISLRFTKIPLQKIRGAKRHTFIHSCTELNSLSAQCLWLSPFALSYATGSPAPCQVFPYPSFSCNPSHQVTEFCKRGSQLCHTYAYISHS